MHFCEPSAFGRLSRRLPKIKISIPVREMCRMRTQREGENILIGSKDNSSILCNLTLQELRSDIRSSGLQELVGPSQDHPVQSVCRGGRHRGGARI